MAVYGNLVVWKSICFYRVRSVFIRDGTTSDTDYCIECGGYFNTEGGNHDTGTIVKRGTMRIGDGTTSEPSCRCIGCRNRLIVPKINPYISTGHPSFIIASCICKLLIDFPLVS